MTWLQFQRYLTLMPCDLNHLVWEMHTIDIADDFVGSLNFNQLESFLEHFDTLLT